VIQVKCARCNAKSIVARSVQFDGMSRSLCPDCAHAFSRWFLHERTASRSGPLESGVSS
jgi:transposase-like protein